jgi:leader peptidase (prepilin peptidase) / N-methyltransferase
VLIILIVAGHTATPFGPYLCMGTLYVLVRWDAIWNRWIVPALGFFGGFAMVVAGLLGMGLLMGAMLSLYRMFKTALIERTKSTS